MLNIYGRRYDNGEPVVVRVAGNRIAGIEPAWPAGSAADWPFVAPGLFDLQINGHGGIWYSDAALTPERVVATLDPHFQFGITRIFPTLITASHAALAAGFSAIRAACEQDSWIDEMIAGCHLEGPYIASEDGPRGAHPREDVRPADWDEFCRLQELSGNRIRLVTLAPEVPQALDFIRKAVASGVTIALGHTGATPEQVTAAVDAGARLSTHLGNGSHAIIRRHPNYIWEQLADPRLWASIIADGHHLPASVVRTIIRTKTPARTVLTCDAAGFAGCAPGVYAHGTGKVELLPSGKIVVFGQDQILAGSSLATDTCVVNAMQFAGVPLRDAIDMATRNPARLLGCDEPRLVRGARADLFLFRIVPEQHRLDVVATIATGKVRHGAIPAE